jgi:hypothetical protein
MMFWIGMLVVGFVLLAMTVLWIWVSELAVDEMFEIEKQLHRDTMEYFRKRAEDEAQD